MVGQGGRLPLHRGGQRPEPRPVHPCPGRGDHPGRRDRLHGGAPSPCRVRRAARARLAGAARRRAGRAGDAPARPRRRRGRAGARPAAGRHGRGAAARLDHGGGRARVRRSRPPRFALTLGLRDLVGLWRTEALLGVIAIALGAAMLGGVVLVAAAFRGQLDTTVLGVYLGERVRPFHVAVAALTLAIGALAAGQIVTLGYLERQAQLAALRALGWPRAHVLRLLAAQGLALGALASVLVALVAA